MHLPTPQKDRLIPLRVPCSVCVPTCSGTRKWIVFRVPLPYKGNTQNTTIQCKISPSKACFGGERVPAKFFSAGRLSAAASGLQRSKWRAEVDQIGAHPHGCGSPERRHRPEPLGPGHAGGRRQNRHAAGGAPSAPSGGRAGNPRVDHGRRGATRLATPDFLPGRAGFLTSAAAGLAARKTAPALHFSGVCFTNFTPPEIPEFC